LKASAEKAKAVVSLQKELREVAEREKNCKKLLTQTKEELQVS
jgi:hypothetical protein